MRLRKYSFARVSEVFKTWIYPTGAERPMDTSFGGSAAGPPSHRASVMRAHLLCSGIFVSRAAAAARRTDTTFARTHEDLTRSRLSTGHRIVAPRRATSPPPPRRNWILSSSGGFNSASSIHRSRRPPTQITERTRSRLMSAFVSDAGFPTGSPAGTIKRSGTERDGDTQWGLSRIFMSP